MMKIRFFSVLMLISGFAGISYEILYGRILGNLIGDQFAVSAAVLITFLFGIALGSRYAWRLWSWLWLIELLIGVCGLIFVLATDVLDSLLYASLPLLPDGLSGSILISVLLLFLPAFLIGCSVPLFAGYMSRLAAGVSFPKVYAIYNIGAAITAVLIEYVLLRWLGIEGTVVAFAVLNICVAVLLRFSFSMPSPQAAQHPMKHHSMFWMQLIPISMASAVFQLLMVKWAEMLLGPFRESFALVLSIVLLGIALGSLMVRLLSLKFNHIVLLALASILVCIMSVEPVAYMYAALYDTASNSYLGVVLLKWCCLLLLMGLPALAFGATVPALIAGDSDDVSRESGYVLFVAAMANVAGFVLMVFVLHRYVDYGLILLVISALCGLSLLLSQRFKLRSIMIVGALCISSAVAYGQYWDEDLLYVSYTNFRDTDDLNQARETSKMPEKFKGYQDVFAINWVNGSPYFFINGYNSIPLNNPSEKIVGVLSSMYAENHDRALVLGLGSGGTASVVGQLFKQTDVVEINPVVRKNLFRMRQWNFDIESNPRVNIVVDDAIHYTKAVQHTYDLILNTVTTPLYFSSSKLYTRNFFDVVKQRLQPGGIYVTWMDGRVGDKGADIILNTIAGSFKHCALLYIKSSYFLLICSDNPIRTGDLPEFKPGHVVYDHLLQQDGIIPEWLKYQLLTDDALALVADTTLPLNEADYPALEFEMAHLSGRGISSFKTRLRQTMDLNEVHLATGAKHENAHDSAELVWHTMMRLKNSSFSRQWKQLAEQKYGPSFEHSYQQVRYQYIERLYGGEMHPDRLHSFAYQLMRVHEYKDALHIFQRVLERDAAHNDTNFNMAACYEYMGQFKSAIDYYQREAKLDPMDEDVPYRLGRVLVKMQRYAEALPYLKRAIVMMGEAVSDGVYIYIGKAYTGMGQDQAAKQAYKQAEKIQSH